MVLIHGRQRKTVAELCAENPNLPFCPRPSEQFVPSSGGGGGGIETRNNIQTNIRPGRFGGNETPTVIIPPSLSDLKAGAEGAKNLGNKIFWNIFSR